MFFLWLLSVQILLEVRFAVLFQWFLLVKLLLEVQFSSVVSVVSVSKTIVGCSVQQ